MQKKAKLQIQFIHDFYTIFTSEIALNGLRGYFYYKDLNLYNSFGIFKSVENYGKVGNTNSKSNSDISSKLQK